MAHPTDGGAPLADLTRPQRLRRWVVVLGVFVIVANAAAAAYDQWRSYRLTVGNTERELANAARILAAQTAGNLRTVDVLLRDVADTYRRPASTAENGDVNAGLAGRVEGLQQLVALTIADAEGAQRYRSTPFDTDNPPNVAYRSYFAAQRDNPAVGLFVSEPFETQVKRRPVMVMSRRLTSPTGQFAGVVAGMVDLDRFQQFYREIKLGPRSSIIVVRDDGTLVVREPPAGELMGRRFPELPPWFSQEGATRGVSPMDGVRRFFAGAHVDGFPLVIAVAREEAAVLDPWRQEVFRVVVRTALLSALIGLAIVALLHQLRRADLGERALRESEERYALAMEGANEGHFDRNILDGGSGFMSPKMRDLLGLHSRGQMMRSEALVNVHPEDRAKIDAAFDDLVQGRTDRYDVDYRVLHEDGEWHWLQVRGRCLRDSGGVRSRLVGSAIDITERKRAEAQKDRLEVQLRKSQKMEAMGTLAGGIAHDFNNILGAILGYGELAQKSAAPGSVMRRYIDNVMQAAGRAKALVERILAFSRSGIGERAPLNVESVIAEALELLAASLPARVQLEHKLTAGDAAVIADATQLHQVVMNLCTNAVQAMPAGGVLEVCLERFDVAKARTAFQGDVAQGPYVRLVVRDTGTGIEPQILDRMFDPFFTTKGVGVGTGLGLSLVHGIVTDVGGAIDVTTAVDEGTTFTIWLPVVGSASPPKPEDSDDVPHGNGESIMIVDDEPSLVELAEEMLAELGYEPAGFRSSAAALTAFADDPRRFDLVLTDEMMPDVSGTSLAMEIRRLRPDIPIVIMSGYVDTDVMTLARSAGVKEVLRKPLRGHELAEALGRALPVAAT
jgi:PAS domain S-box-containing protein